MTKTKQTTAVVLSFVLIVSAMLGQLSANMIVSAAGYGISNPRTDSGGVTTWDCIWFGNYWQNSETTKEPIKWRVLSVNGDDAFLLANQNLDCQPYHTVYTGAGVTWETCSLRAWLNSTFYKDAFSAAEQSAIRTTTVINEDNPKFGTAGGNNTQDKVYLLSIAEAGNAVYGFFSEFHEKSETRQSKNTEYAKIKGAYTSPLDSYAGKGWWWLRSPGGSSSYAAARVSYIGWGGSRGTFIRSSYGAVRPALHINLSSSTWSKAGTVSASRGSTGGATSEPTQTLPAERSEETVSSVPTKNTKLKDKKGNTYAITRAGKTKGEVSYTVPKNNKITSVSIPATVKLKDITYKVTSIKANAFKKCKKLKKVTIGKNIKTIGKNAFFGCARLKNIIIETTKLTKKSIGSKAFAKLHKKLKIKVPKKKWKAYKEIFRKKGVTGKKQISM